MSFVFNSDVDTNLTIYLTGTDKEVDLEIFNGTLSEYYAQLNYDLLFTTYDGSITTKLKNVNLTDNKTLGMDKKTPAETGYLATYGIESEAICYIY